MQNGEIRSVIDVEWQNNYLRAVVCCDCCKKTSCVDDVAAQQVPAANQRSD